ncbi:DNA primase [Endothiovibrio diazotrophicus]
MAGRIPQHFIDDLVNRVDIVDVVNSRVELKKAGREYKACCPFHNEKTPSFYVIPDKQFYHCFGCGAHGTAIGFLMEYDHLSFVEAVEELAREVGVEVEREQGRPLSPAQQEARRAAPDLYDLLEQASQLFQANLRRHPEAPLAVEYLKGRGLTGEIAKAFGIGYAPSGWDNLRKALGGNPEKEKRLLLAGLLTEKEGGDHCYDRFRERVMFPIRDRRGRVIGFGGRVLGAGEPKYLNSPETPVFHKGKELYGLWEAQQALRSFERLLVVEGYMDVVALAQFGIRYAVATLGTATTPDHLDRLFRAAPEVVFCFDGDRAGRDAAWRALDNALPALGSERRIRFLFLPEGEDPDSMVRSEGREAFEARIGHAPSITDYLLETLAGRADMNSVEGPARLVELARPLLARMPKGAFRENLLLRLADRTRMEPERLGEALGLRVTTRPPPSAGPRYPSGAHAPFPSRRPPAARPRTAAYATRSLAEQAAARLLLRPQLAAEAGDPNRFLELEMPGVRLLVELLNQLTLEPASHTGALLERWRDREQAPLLWELLGSVELAAEEAIDREFLDALERMDHQRRIRRREALWRNIGSLDEEEKMELRELERALRGTA